jgi:geranylgeranyl diphosphate synthase type II
MTVSTVPTDLVIDRLHEVSTRVRRAMLDAIPDGEPHRWLYRLMRAYPTRTGKGLRPALCLAACGAFGGAQSDAFGVAVVIEMLHNAFLVHDDIADGSLRRRGRSTLPADHGPGLALNAGDALAVLANQLLRRHTHDLAPTLAERVFAEFDAMALRTIEGQATELGWQRERVTDITPEDYLGLILHKSCWYTTIHPLRVGALIGSAGTADLDALVRFGFFLGAAFQIRDDLLNLIGEEALYGKEINGDIVEGKRTLPLIHLIQHADGGDRTVVLEYLALDRSQRSPALVAAVRALLDRYGSLQFAADYAQGIASAASDAFDVAFAEATGDADVAFIRALVPYMLGRRS